MFLFLKYNINTNLHILVCNENTRYTIPNTKWTKHTILMLKTLQQTKHYVHQPKKQTRQTKHHICQPNMSTKTSMWFCISKHEFTLSRGNFFANLITFGLKMRWRTKNYKYEECLCGVTLFVWFTFVWVNTNAQGHLDAWIRICGDLSKKWGHWVEAWGLHHDVYLRKSSAFAAKPFATARNQPTS